MEIITDELRKNGVNVDITVLSQYIQYVLERHEDMYEEISNLMSSSELLNIFNEMDVNSAGRVVAYLALVYRMNITNENMMREAVRLVVPVLQSLAIVEGSLIQRLCSGDGYAMYSFSLGS